MSSIIVNIVPGSEVPSSTVHVHSTLIQTSDVHVIIEESKALTKKSLLIFDIGNVLLNPRDAALHRSHKPWMKEWIKTHAPHEVWDELEPLIYRDAKQHIVDPALIGLIEDRKNTTNVLALSLYWVGPSLLPNCTHEEQWLNHLKEAGIEFGEPFPNAAGWARSDLKATYANGLIATDIDSELKGPVFEAFLEQMPFKPDRIVFVDDRLDQCTSMLEAARKNGIPALVIHYTKGNECAPQIDEQIAEVQFGMLVNKKVWLSDEQAKDVVAKKSELAAEGMTVEELHRTDMKKLYETCKQLSDAYIVKPFVDTSEAWKKDKNFFIEQTLWTYPFDDSRTAREITNFYLNASNLVIEGQRYIASQAPLTSTYKDFWKATLHEGSPTIVMLNMPEDDTDPPVPIEYWKQTCEVDDWSITCTNTQELMKEISSAIVRREFTAKNSQTAEVRTIVQFHYQKWPDFQAAPSNALFDSLLAHVEEAHPWPERPLTVHCAAGMGRSGIVIAAHALRRKIRGELAHTKPEQIKVNLVKTIFEMRQRRKNMVSKEGVACIAANVQNFVQRQSRASQ